MRASQFLLAMVVALAAAGCMRHDPDANERGLLSSQAFAPQSSHQTYQQRAPGERGLFTSQSSAPQVYAQQPLQPPAVLQYVPPPAAAPAPRYATPQYRGGAYAAPAYAYAPAAAEQPYTLDAGDKLRVVVFGQDGISNTYIVDAGGNVSLPLIGSRAGARHHHAAARAADRRAAQAGLRARTACDGGGRDLPAVLHPRRGDHARAISVTSPT